MKIKYLGTAAFEGIPAVFCNCPQCEEARKLGGKNLRSRSQLLINDDLLIDFPPDSFFHFAKYGIDSSKIKYILITHSHSDHFYPEDLCAANDQYTSNSNLKFLDVYLGQDSIRKLNFVKEEYKSVWDKNRVRYHEIKYFDNFTIGKYNITVLHANHEEYSTPMFFIVDDGEKRILYAHDTGYFLNETWEYLSKETKPFDLVSIDCTFGGYDWPTHEWGHMNIALNKEVVQKLKEMKLLSSKTPVILNHFCHKTLENYDGLVPLVKDDGFIISYDGLEFNL